MAEISVPHSLTRAGMSPTPWSTSRTGSGTEAALPDVPTGSRAALSRMAGIFRALLRGALR
jgi:hypothetical protein